MPARLLTATALVIAAITAAVVLGVSGTAWARDNAGNYGHARASTGHGAVSVSAGYASVPTTQAGSPGQGENGSTAPPDPDQLSGCTFAPASQADQALLGVGGPQAGEWETETCTGPHFINPLPVVWVVLAKPQAPVDPAALAQQAAAKLPLPSPSIEMAPPAGAEQLVNLATWLWVGPSAWQPFSATATAGPVSATAMATPVKVVWDMGDGDTVTCAGPGTPYDPSDPSAPSDCSYTWAQSSAGQPGGTYQVTATIYFQVTWAATGAAGGGDLGLVPGPAAHIAVQVAESQALNNTPGS